MSRDELIRLVAERDAQVAARDGQIAVMAGQLSELMEANEVLAGKLARLEHLLSRNSKNSSSPSSKDDDPGKTPPAASTRRGGGPTRSKGKQPGAAGANLAWRDTPDERTDRFPQGRCECGHDLAGAKDLGVLDCYQQHCAPLR
jgi:transposase